MDECVKVVVGIRVVVLFCCHLMNDLIFYLMLVFDYVILVLYII